MIKIFLALGTIVSLGTPLLPQRGIERAPITSTDNIIYHVGDIWRVSFNAVVSYLYNDVGYIDINDSDVDEPTFYLLNFNVNYGGDLRIPISTFYDFSLKEPCYSIYGEFYEVDSSHFSFWFEATSENYDYSFSPNQPYSIRQDVDLILSFDLSILSTEFAFYPSLYDGTYGNNVNVERIKEGGSYVAPQKSNLYRYIYDFYYSLFNEADLTAITISGLNNMPFDSWLCHTLTIITLLTGVVILFLLLRWLFKVVSGFILLK